MLTVSYSISHQKDPRAPTAITSTDETDESLPQATNTDRHGRRREEDD